MNTCTGIPDGGIKAETRSIPHFVANHVSFPGVVTIIALFS
jgi:hypothetical protein